jgi:hypothetical protein
MPNDILLAVSALHTVGGPLEMWRRCGVDVETRRWPGDGSCCVQSATLDAGLGPCVSRIFVVYNFRSEAHNGYCAIVRMIGGIGL